MEQSIEYFREEQQFRQPWIWLIVGFSLFALLPLWYGVYQQIVQGVPYGDEPASDEMLLVVTGVMTVLILGILFLFWNSRLVVSLGPEGIRYRFTPFHRRIHVIHWEEVSKAYVRTYRPIIEYGGWGIRFGLKGKAYNVSGTEGLQLVLRNGRTVLFGTQEPERVSLALSRIPGIEQVNAG